MKIQILSDLHFEMRNWRSLIEKLDPSGVDVLVLAGDILPASRKTEKMLTLFRERYPHVVYVPGNHEYWGTSLSAILRLEEAAANARVSFLRPGNIVTIAGRRFLGDTMWFPQSMEAALERHWADYIYINGATPSDIFGLNAAFRAFLEEELREGDVVITHHLPHPQSIGPNYTNSPTNVFFLSDQSDLIEERKPALWVHGHTHDPYDYVVGATRIVCNPYGYPSEVGDADPTKKVVEV